MAIKREPFVNEGRPVVSGTSASASEESAFDILRKFFESYGIEFDAQIEGVIKDAMLNGFGPEQIEFIMPDLQKTEAFKRRFPGFNQRIANGYNALSLGEYLKLEDAYAEKLAFYGLPKGFYDDPSDYGQWIAGNVSVAEIENRARLAFTAAQEVDPTTRNLLAKFYGLGTGDLASYFLDKNRSLPLIEKQYDVARMAGFAARNGLDVSNIRRYEDLYAKGVGVEAAASGYGTVKALKDYVGAAAGVYGETYNQSDAEMDVFFNQSDKRRSILSKEAATFGGSSAGQTGSARRNSY